MENTESGGQIAANWLGPPMITRDSIPQRLPLCSGVSKLKLRYPGPVADHFVPLLNLVSILWKCSAASPALGLVTYPLRSGPGLELPPPDLLQVSDTLSRMVVLFGS